jgi:prepilin-type N-terminal cleavage/methylation domain-containing protein
MISSADARPRQKRPQQNSHSHIRKPPVHDPGRTALKTQPITGAERYSWVNVRCRPRHASAHAQGFTLVELMVSLVIVLIVATVTIKIEANVFESNGRSINMIQLTQQMRSAIQLISRDIRRAGYNDDALARFLSTQGISSGIAMGTLDANGNANCLQVSYDDLDGNARNVVYRLRVVDAVGRIAANFAASATCDTSIGDTGWKDITDPLLVTITGLEFTRNDQLTDVAENLSNGHTIQVGLEEIRITINASLRGNNNVSRSIVNEVQIRNQYLTV